MERRKYVGGTVSLLTVGLAGCTGDSLDISVGDGGSDSSSDADRSDSSSSGNRSDSSSGGNSLAGRPEAVAEAFFEAAAEGNIERQEELIHEEATSVEPINEEVNLIINEINSRTLEEIAAERSQSISEEEFEATRESLQEQTAAVGAVDYTHVYYNIETEQYGPQDGYLLLVSDGREWLIYSYGVGFESVPTESTDEERSQQVSSRLQIQNVVGYVTDEQTIDEVSLTVTKAPGSGDIDLENVTYEFITEDSVTADVIAADQISVIAAETDNNVVSDRSDRYQITFVAATHLDGALEGGDLVTVTLTTAAGASTVTQLRVPDSLVDRDAVAL